MSEKTINRAYEAQVQAVFVDLLGADFIKLVPNPSHPDSIVYTGVGGSTTLVFKMMDPHGRDKDRIAAEAWSLTKARSVGVPTPAVVRVDGSKSLLPSTYMVMEQVRGTDLRTPQLSDDEMRPYLLKIGRMLKQLHTAKVDGYGFLDQDEAGQVRGVSASWHAAALDAFEDGLRTLRDGELISAEQSQLAQKIVRESEPLLAENYNSLLHGDVGPIHVFADLEMEDLTGLIDFGECKSGDPVWDLVDLRGRYVPTVIEGYAPDAAMRSTLQDRFALYGILRNMIWALRWHNVWPNAVANAIGHHIAYAADHFKL